MYDHGWNGETSSTLIQIIPKMFNGIQIRAFGRPVINKRSVIGPEETLSVPSCMTCGIIMLKKSEIGIFFFLKHWDNVLRKNFNSVALGIQIPFDKNEISAKAICSACPDQERTPIPKTISFKYATVGITFSPTVYSTLPSPR